MHRLKFFFSLSVILMLAMACRNASSISNASNASSSDKSGHCCCPQEVKEGGLFRMMLRLWPEHHNNPVLSEQLLQALDKYNFWDEVWLCAELPMTLPLFFHEASARRMTVLADSLRARGILVSLQAVSIGHGEGLLLDQNQSDAIDSTIHWTTMTGTDGRFDATVNCPRQKAFLDKIGQAYACYAAQVRPHSIYLDDDLRLTKHGNLAEGCYCDSCLAAFNREYGYHFSRESLVAALKANQPGIREKWTHFGQESLAGVARVIARSVHKVSPETRLGLQHTSFHRQLLEGRDWNPIFRAMQEETGMAPVSRPGHGFYSDAAPRGMLKKGLELARQIRRLPSDVVEIAPEIEGFRHKASGKSPQSLCLETMYYLALGGTQMSYAIICTGEEPMSWYADNYFRFLERWKPYAREYAAFNEGTVPAGIDPYISPNLLSANSLPGEDDWTWTKTRAGEQAFALAALGFPFAPEAEHPLVRMLDEDQLPRYSAAEKKALRTHSVVISKGAADINDAQRRDLLARLDRASGGKLPVLLENFAQVAIVPRVDAKGCLRSVALMNCSISEQENYSLILRMGADSHREPRLVWKRLGRDDVPLYPVRAGRDWKVTVPGLPAWDFGWIAVERKNQN